MNKHHEIKEVKIDNNILSLIIDGKKHQFLLDKISKRLAKASKIEKENFEISPSGYGIHWNLIDEDLSIDGLLRMKHSTKKTRDLNVS